MTVTETELECGFEAQLGGLLLALPLWAVYWLAASLLPGAALLLLPLQALPIALGLAWNLLDYPLTLRGVQLRARWQLLRGRPAPIFGFGLCMALGSLVPGAALLLLPVGVAGAAELALRLLPDGAAARPENGAAARPENGAAAPHESAAAPHERQRAAAAPGAQGTS